MDSSTEISAWNTASTFHRQGPCTSLYTCTGILFPQSLPPHTHTHTLTQLHMLTQKLRCHIEHASVCPLTDRKAAETAGSLWWGELWTPAVSGSVCSSPCEGSPAAASSSPPQTWHPADRQRERGETNRAGKKRKESSVECVMWRRSLVVMNQQRSITQQLPQAAWIFIGFWFTLSVPSVTVFRCDRRFSFQKKKKSSKKTVNDWLMNISEQLKKPHISLRH